MSMLESIFKQHKDWCFVKSILERLESAGFLAYLAGGCIRDALLGIIPQDFDVATSAQPKDIISLFPNSNKQGKAFGVVAVFFNSNKDQPPHSQSTNLPKKQAPLQFDIGLEHGMVEVATFRKDGPYLDGRHPEYVEFLSDKEDAMRRDFTVNALFYHLRTHKIIDYVRGQKDLQNKRIRTVGCPEKRFIEDKLRIIRAFRFCVQLDFKMEPATQKAVFQMRDRLWEVSKERIYNECLKMLRTGKIIPVMESFKTLGLLQNIHPVWGTDSIDWEFCQKFWKSAGDSSNLSTVTDQGVLWSYALYPLLIQTKKLLTLHGKWESSFSQSLKKWKFSLVQIRQIQDVFYGSCCLLPPLDRQVTLAHQLKMLNSPFRDTILFLSRNYLKKLGKSADLVSKIEYEFNKRSPHGTLPSPLVRGRDLKNLGVPADKNMAQYLARLYDYQLEKEVTQKELLLQMARTWLKPDSSEKGE